MTGVNSKTFDFDGALFSSFMGAVVGLILGGLVGFAKAQDTAHDFETKDALRAECIRGNDRACRMYEVDYGRG